jgi:hypothetical protein
MTGTISGHILRLVKVKLSLCLANEVLHREDLGGEDV